MHQLEVFFDYVCPFCYRGHEYLKELLPAYPQVEIIWRPCEAHPRPERYGAHSDLCIRGMFFAQEQGADLWAYHERMFEAIFRGDIDIENLEALSACVQGVLRPQDFIRALRGGAYEGALAQANDYAYEECGVWAVPSYRMSGRKLDSIENIGVSRAELKAFLDTAPR